MPLHAQFRHPALTANVVTLRHVQAACQRTRHQGAAAEAACRDSDQAAVAPVSCCVVSATAAWNLRAASSRAL